MSPDDDEMDNPDFSPRQIVRLEQMFAEQGFNERQLAQLKKMLAEQGFNERQLAQLKQMFAEQEVRLSAEIGSVVRTVMEDVIRQFGLFEDKYKDAPARVQRIEDEQLPERVEKLEAAVFPPKPQRRARKH